MKVQNTVKILLLVCVGVLIGCSESGDSDTPPPQAKKISEIDIPKFEGSRSKPIQSAQETGTNPEDVHPGVKEGVEIDRGIIVPKDVDGQWKAVKIMVRNKIDESRSSMKTASLGSSFELEGSAIKVTVGPFMPNFVMTQTNYTSKGNELTNPAVRLVVEENGKTLYEGWAFAKYPTMYAFEHEEFAFQLMDYIPADVS
ncbi:MAG: hypothetical protein F3743_09155 [Nitrospinae bacterium]|nr:hypothetical protein [Nitrospinota bacterium]MZH13752.1 hypothetical protein [Nitrospinota bacterium]